MADLSSIKVGRTTYNIKDPTARSDIATQSSQISALETLLRDILPAEYRTSETYAVGAVCMHSGLMYQATQTTSGAWNASHWTQVRINNVAVLGYTEV